MSSYYARRPLQSSGCSNSDSCWDGAPIEITESGPSVAGRLAALASRMTIKPLMTVGSYLSPLPLPLGFVDFACRVWRPGQGTVRTTINLPNATAQLVRAPGVRAADGAGRVVLYLHGGAFVMCGPNSHSRIVNALSGARGYRPEQIVLAGDSAGGYLALALAQRLQCDDEKPAAIVAISPLLQLAKGPKQDHPNIGTDAMFPARAFDALAAWVRAAAAKNMVDGRPEDLYEPLDHIESSLPPTLIHVSGSEVLLHDAQLGAGKLAAAGVCAEVRVWPGQAHLFQLATPLVPEATRSLRQIGQFIRDATADSSLSPVHRSRYVAGSPRAASRGAFGQSPI